LRSGSFFINDNFLPWVWNSLLVVWGLVISHQQDFCSLISPLASLLRSARSSFKAWLLSFFPSPARYFFLPFPLSRLIGFFFLAYTWQKWLAESEFYPPVLARLQSMLDFFEAGLSGVFSFFFLVYDSSTVLPPWGVFVLWTRKTLGRDLFPYYAPSPLFLEIRSPEENISRFELCPTGSPCLTCVIVPLTMF